MGANLAGTVFYSIKKLEKSGKTTTTERLLYIAGETTAIGEVDYGDTVTDYMDQERERGDFFKYSIFYY